MIAMINEFGKWLIEYFTWFANLAKACIGIFLGLGLHYSFSGVMVIALSASAFNISFQFRVILFVIGVLVVFRPVFEMERERMKKRGRA